MGSQQKRNDPTRPQEEVSPLTLAEFRVSWCPACKEQSLVLEQLEREFPKRLSLLRIDIEKHSARAIEAGVQSVPTLIVYERGKEVARFIGFHDRNQIGAFLRKKGHLQE